jgi:SagB-type dehydrogenase family enzyme
VVIDLPAPRLDGSIAVERALAERRSRRRFKRRRLTLSEISQLLWAAQGVTTREGDRTAPSAGALFPLELTLAAGEVAELPTGLYRYEPAGHRLRSGATGDRRKALASAAIDQEWVQLAAAVLVVAGVVARTAARYGSRAERYVLLEVGAACENVHLQAEALGLATVMVGAFDDGEVQAIAELEPNERPFMLMPVGER